VLAADEAMRATGVGVSHGELPKGRCYVSETVSTSEEDSEHDACPSCGTRVESAISAPGEPVREATKRRCPNCGKVLQREVGGEWTIDEAAT
jgi:predicted RNA-binding Zn-ribbon protein involved in translation (DUF1610 family)